MSATGRPRPIPHGSDSVRLVEIELAQPMPALLNIDVPTGRLYNQAQLLIRWHGRPVGIVKVDLGIDGLSPARCASAIWRELGPEINTFQLNHGRSSLTGLSINGLTGDPPPFPPAPYPPPLVSVIIPTRDRPGALANCLATLFAQDYANTEIIVVDNAPALPSTRALIDRLQGDGRVVRLVSEARPGISNARNCGLAAARGEIIACIDDDMIADRRWLSELVAGFSMAPGVACVTGLVLPAELETAAQNWFEQYGGFSKGFTPTIYDSARWRPMGVAGRLYPYKLGMFGGGGNMAISAAVLRQIGGYDAALGAGSHVTSGEDLAIFFKVITSGHRLVYRPAALAWHYHRREYSALQRQIYGYGVGLTAALTKCMVDEPIWLLGLLWRLPLALMVILDPRSVKNQHKRPDYPHELTQLELKGMIYGPLAYLRSCWHQFWVAEPAPLPAGQSHGRLAALQTHLRTPLYQNAYLLLLNEIFNAGLGIIFWILAARLYTTEVVGFNSAAISTMTLLAELSFLTFRSVLLRFLPRAGEHTARLIINAYVVGSLLAAVFGLGFVAWLGWWQPTHALVSQPAFLAWFALSPVIWALFSLQDNALTGLRRPGWILLENSLYGLLKIGLMVLLVGPVSSYGIFASFVVPAALAIVPINLLIFARIVPSHMRRTRAQTETMPVRMVVSFAASDYVGALLNMALNKLLPLIVLGLVGASATAHFFLAWMIAYSVQLVIASMTASLTVEAAADRDHLIGMSRRILHQMMRLVGPAIVALLLAAEPMLGLFGWEYAEEGTVLLRLLTISALPMMITSLYLGFARVQRQLRGTILLQACLMIGVLGLSWWAIPIYGIAGIGLAQVLVQSLAALVLIFTSLRPMVVQSPGPAPALSAEER